MSSLVVHPEPRTGDARRSIIVVGAALIFAAVAAGLAGWLPLGFSIVTVFLFAGPHNWLEARYFLTRLPARWGKLRPFFLVAFTGIFGLTASYAAMTVLGQAAQWDARQWYYSLSIWNSVFVLWIMTLIQMRSRQNPRRDWFWTLPIGFFLIALTWLDPYLWSLAMVYAHPCMAFLILDRELKRSRSPWRKPFRWCMATLPVLLGILWLRLASAPDLPGDDALTLRISNHAGAGILEGVSTHLLVATHTFLEMLHYGIWLLAIPLVAFRFAPWNVQEVPMARRSPAWSRLILGVLITGGVVCLVLWGCFLADYPLTRDVYFTVALMHVLAEIPFLLRAL